MMGTSLDRPELTQPLAPTPLRAKICFTLALLFTLLTVLTPQARAADTIFTSGTAIRNELARLGGEGKLFVTAPVDPYLPETLGVAGAFALTYVFDRDIRSDLAGVRSTALNRVTDGAGFVGSPYLHLGVAAALYGAGAVADAPKLLRVGEELGEALIFADTATLVLREAIGRGRPNTGESSSRFRPFQFSTDYDSLPSMHTASSFALAHVLASETESLPVKMLYYAGATFVGFSRMYQGKHWASDVIVAAAIGELAGNSVTRYRGLQKGGVTIAPVLSGGVPTLALLGRF